MNCIVPSRITEAREARALSMEEFAKRIGVTRQSVSKYERGIINPSLETLQDIAWSLNFPVEFFYKPDVGCVARGSAMFFRSNSNISKKVKTACKCQIKWTHEIKRQLEAYVEFIEKDLPTLEIDYEDLTDEDIESLSLSLRYNWKINDDPINDLIGLLENRGIIVSCFSVSNECEFKGIDAFSAWEDGSPYILYNPIQKSAVRTRFSLAHELGHLIMHSGITDEDAIKKEVIDLADRQADRFAAALLLPSTAFPNEVRSSSLVSLELIKKKWGVSFATIIKRCEVLDLLTANQINYVKRQMTTKKYWHKEPLDDIIMIKGPEMLKDAIELLIDNQLITRQQFINDSAFSSADLKHICALADSFFEGYNTRQKPLLRVVSRA